jgi:hypothetical protein
MDDGKNLQEPFHDGDDAGVMPPDELLNADLEAEDLYAHPPETVEELEAGDINPADELWQKEKHFEVGKTETALDLDIELPMEETPTTPSAYTCMRLAGYTCLPPRMKKTWRERWRKSNLLTGLNASIFRSMAECLHLQTSSWHCSRSWNIQRLSFNSSRKSSSWNR